MANSIHPNRPSIPTFQRSAALRIAVEHCMRITVPMMLMSAKNFGDWTRYLPRNPGLM